MLGEGRGQVAGSGETPGRGEAPLGGMTVFHRWLAEVFSHPGLLAAAAIVGKTVLVYLFVVVGIRLLGTRELGEMNSYDFVLVVVIANAVQNALVGGDNTLVGGLTSALTLLVLNRLFTATVNRFPWLERHATGEPVVLVKDAQVRWRLMHREGVSREELMAALREHGVGSLDKVGMAVLEMDGTISVVPRDANVQGTRPRRPRIRGMHRG